MRGNPRVWVAFALLSATFFMLLVDFSIVSIALPSMERELGMSASQGQWIVSTYAIFLAGFLMLTGRCADLFGRFRFFIAGLVLFTLASFLGGLATTGTFLIAMRALQGLGAALVNPAALAIVLSMFPSGEERSRAVALWGTIGSLGVAAGMFFGGVLVQYLGWRSVLYVNVPVALAILAIAPSMLPRDRGERGGAKLDVLGAALLTTALVTLVFTIESIPGRGLAAWQTLVGFAMTVALFGALVAAERRALEPILPRRLFAYPDLLSGASIVFLQPMSYAGVLVFASVYVQRVSGYEPLFAGLAFLPSSLLVSLIAAPLTMPIARAIGVRTMCIASAFVMIAGETILLWMQPHSSYWSSIFVSTCIGGFGGMLAYQSGMIGGLAHVDDADEGSASAVLSFALQLGIGFGVALGAAAEELRTNALQAAGAQPIAALAGGLQASFWFAIAAGVAVIAAAAFGLRHAATAKIPLRHYIAFGKLHHAVSVKA
ncbi:MAG TPA: MFS transporter [Candidatus Cybelea sp.]|jgi:EmrB/QacA subfamily drug resistance transporter|nr:MFS transporter [Candidatus Cybelea sp.]